MPDDSLEFKIKITGDASSGTAAANQTIADQARIADAVRQTGDTTETTAQHIEHALEKATESTHSLQGEQLGSLRTAHHLFEGVKEIAEGGTAAVAGLATEVRVAAEVFESMLGPAAPFIIILSTLLAVGLPSLTKNFGEAGAAAKKGKEGTDDLGKSLDEMAKSEADAKIKAITEALREQLSALATTTKEMVAQSSAAEGLLRAQRELADAKISSQLADLDEQEGIDLAGKDADQRLKIKQDYEQRRQALKQEIERENAKAAVEEKRQGVVAAQQAIANNANQAAVVQQALQGAHDTINAGAPAGIKSDAEVAAERLEQLRTYYREGHDGRAISPAEEQERRDLESKVPQMQQREGATGKEFTEGLASLQEELKTSRARELEALSPYHVGADGVRVGADPEVAASERANQDKIAAAIKVITDYTESVKAAKAKLDDKESGVPKLQELRAQQPELQTKLDTAQTALQAAQTKASEVDTKQRAQVFSVDQSQEKETAQRALENRDARRKQQLDGIDSRIKAATDQAFKDVLEKQKAGIQAGGERDRAQVDLSSGKIGQDEYQERIEHARDISTNADTTVRNQDRAARQKEVKTESADAKRALDAAEKAAEAAARAHPELLKGIKGITDVTLRNAVLIAELTSTLDPALREIGRRLGEAEQKHEGLKNSVRNTH